MFLAADLVNFGDKWIPERRTQSEDEVDDALLERLSTRIDIVQAAYLNDELQGTLSYFRVLVHAPLACKACHLFVVFSNDHFKGTFSKFLTRLDHH